MKKYLFLLVAAIVSFTTSFTLTSCGSDEETYAMKSEIVLENLNEEQTAVLQDLINTTKDVTVGVHTYAIAKNSVDLGCEKLRSGFEGLKAMLKDGQKITYTINLYKGGSATGSPIYSKSIITTKDSVTIK